MTERYYKNLGLAVQIFIYGKPHTKNKLPDNNKYLKHSNKCRDVENYQGNLNAHSSSAMESPVEHLFHE